jgi:hypothetical protein
LFTLKTRAAHFEVTPLFGHIGDEISKNREKKNTGLQGSMKLSLTPNLDDFFLNALNQSLLLLCTVAINVLDPRAFKTESQYFIPLFNKFS